MQINNLTDLANLEGRIRIELSKHDLDEVLVAVQESVKDKEAFVLAAISLFSIRFSLPPITKPRKAFRITPQNFERIYHLVKTYVLAEPSTLDPSANTNYKGSTLIPVLLRIAGNQFNFNIEFWGQYARTLFMLTEMPQKVKFSRNSLKFDIEAAFLEQNKVSIRDFIYVGYIAYTASSTTGKFTGGYFQKAKFQGFELPNDEIIELTFNKLAADQYQMRELYEAYKQPDRLYAPYDFNPLFVFPFVRPWIKTSNTTLDEDRLIAPVPNLILYRLSEGIYYQLFNTYKEKFSRYFGFLFEKYVGEILNHCVEPNQIISEEEIRKTFPENRGKVPDWIIIVDDTATLIECKAAGFNREALATGSEKAIDYSISQIKKGLVQLHEFKDACQRKVKGLEQLAAISNFNLRVVTYETFHLINSTFFKEIIDSEISSVLSNKGIFISDWHILSIDELERVQPHMKQGISFNEIIEMLKAMQFNDVIAKLHKQTGKTFKDSFLMIEQEKMFKNLGLSIMSPRQEEKLFSILENYKRGEISFGQAARMAEVSNRAFLAILDHYKIPVFNYSVEDLHEELYVDEKN